MRIEEEITLLQEECRNLRNAVRWLAGALGSTSAWVGRLNGEIGKTDRDSFQKEVDYHNAKIEELLKHN